jgi:multiple sugar transport system permease protein
MNSLEKQKHLRALARRKFLGMAGDAIVYLILFDFAFVFLYPYLYMVITSLKSPVQLMDMLARWIPREIYLDNYPLAWKGLDYVRSLLNSLLVTALSTLGHLLACSFVAYGFARYKFPGRNLLFGLVLFTLIIPSETVIISLYIQYNKLRWLDTYLPLILPTFLAVGLRGGVFIFIYRQFFMGIPYEYEEAARIDGSGDFGIYWRIVLPLTQPAILVTAILSIVWHWNDYFEPSMYIKSKGNFLLPMSLPDLSFNLEQFMQVADAVNRGVIMAGTFMTAMPILVLYIILQRRFIAGIARTGLTGM